MRIQKKRRSPVSFPFTKFYFFFLDASTITTIATTATAAITIQSQVMIFGSLSVVVTEESAAEEVAAEEVA